MLLVDEEAPLQSAERWTTAVKKDDDMYMWMSARARKDYVGSERKPARCRKCTTRSARSGGLTLRTRRAAVYLRLPRKT